MPAGDTAIRIPPKTSVCAPAYPGTAQQGPQGRTGTGHRLGRPVAEHACLAEEDVTQGLEALESYRSLSLDVALDGRADNDDYTFMDTLGGADSRFGLIEDREAVKPALAMLPERERRILYWRFFEDMTQSAIAAELDLSQMHVSRLSSRALARVRAEVEQNAEQEYGVAA
ncbi:sigma-70 family RNA polymerase sigma factor [Streptomyces chrestomyceticus]|uniref:sigma-70 family RNA polymerase sigma factor n=1 Tax=Streptomyces chrestomyceticus TaxID=68185 RepID=UPI0033D20F97